MYLTSDVRLKDMPPVTGCCRMLYVVNHVTVDFATRPDLEGDEVRVSCFRLDI
jgi:hypothetical protein